MIKCPVRYKRTRRAASNIYKMKKFRSLLGSNEWATVRRVKVQKMEEVLDAKGGQFQEKGEQIMKLNKQQNSLEQYTRKNSLRSADHGGIQMKGNDPHHCFKAWSIDSRMISKQPTD